MCELRVETDEEVVVLQAGEGAFARRGRWEVGDVVEGCGGGQRWDGSDGDERYGACTYRTWWYAGSDVHYLVSCSRAAYMLKAHTRCIKMVRWAAVRCCIAVHVRGTEVCVDSVAVQFHEIVTCLGMRGFVSSLARHFWRDRL